MATVAGAGTLCAPLFLFDYLAHSARPGLGSWSASGPFAHGLGGDCPYLVAGKDGVSPANPLSFGGMIDYYRR